MGIGCQGTFVELGKVRVQTGAGAGERYRA
jgi:hypothetical protein